MSLLPLKESFAANALEQDLKDLVRDLYAAHLQPKVAEIDLYGMPFLADEALQRRFLEQDKLPLPDDELNNYRHRLAFMLRAWRYRNPQRGLHFTRSFLTALFGTESSGAWEMTPLWHPQDLAAHPYPSALKKEGAHDESVDFLTSRVRIQVFETELLPERVLSAISATLPARVTPAMSVSKFLMGTVNITTVAQVNVTVFFSNRI